MNEHETPNSTDDRRRVVVGGTAGAAAAAIGAYAATAGADQSNPYADPEEGALPDIGFTLDRSRAALVVTDPQRDLIGGTWLTPRLRCGRAGGFCSTLGVSRTQLRDPHRRTRDPRGQGLRD